MAGIGVAALAFGIGMAATTAGNALRSKAVKATRQERREREDEIRREDATAEAALYAMEAKRIRADNLQRLLSRRQDRSMGRGV